MRGRTVASRENEKSYVADGALAQVSPVRRGTGTFILGHLSRDNNFESLALETVRSELLNQDIPESEFALAVAHRDRMTGRFDV